MSNAKMPAFPIAVPEGDYAEFGLTKLEYFAGLAMQGIVGNESIGNVEHVKGIARCSVEMAKALIAELDNQP